MCTLRLQMTCSILCKYECYLIKILYSLINIEKVITHRDIT